MESHEFLTDIAVIGIACRFPGAKNYREFWNNLKAGKETITHFSKEEPLDPGVKYLNNPHYVRAKGMLSGIENFDAPFFHMSSREAQIIDPQQRLFLECSWSALEDAGYYSEAQAGIVGVFAGATRSTYIHNNLMGNQLIREVLSDYQLQINNMADALATRVSYKLNFTGPSFTIQTSCSTSLVAVCTACQNLLAYQCDMALAGGVTIHLPHKVGHLYQEGMILSPDGHCRPFDKQAHGTVRSEGVGVVVLKRLEDAIKDNDSIYAVIKGYAVNNDGAMKVGFTAPSVDGQSTAIMTAQEMAAVDPESITYVEAHGTATKQGDPIEIAALKQAFKARGAKKEKFCALGSVKSNIGHTDASAGVAGFIKTCLSLHHRAIPPSLHFTEPNPLLHLEGSFFYVNTEYRDWHAPVCRAGVSSFGIGGTNAHVILEESKIRRKLKKSPACALIPLSAMTNAALKNYKKELLKFLEGNSGALLEDVAYTYQMGRKPFNQRCYLVASSTESAIEILKRQDGHAIFSASADDQAEKSVIFMCPEQAMLYTGMGNSLYLNEPLFRSYIDRCASHLLSTLNVDVRAILYPSLYESSKSTPSSSIEDPLIAQVLTFMLEYSLAQLWIEWGVNPKYLIGQGFGEYVAACIADVFSLEDALNMVVYRKQMNSSSQVNWTVIDPFSDSASKIILHPPKIPFLCNMTGDWVTKEQATDINYWKKQLTTAEPFFTGMQALLQNEEVLLLEVSAEHTTTNFVSLSKQLEKKLFFSLPSAESNVSDLSQLLTTAGELWIRGVPFSWDAFNQKPKGNKISVPGYPFEPHVHWVEPDPKKEVEEESISENKGIDKAERGIILMDSAFSSEEAIRKKLALLWEKYLGVEGSKISFEDDFFDLGGDSLLAIQLFGEINNLFNINIATNSLMQFPTISALAAFIKQEQNPSIEENALPFCLVLLKQGDIHLPPLILPHAVGGDILSYRDLIHHLHTPRSIYGIRSQSLDGKTPLPSSVEEMATAYIQAIFTIQETGPYFLVGHSFGGTLAYEMAQQLFHKGKKVALLALLDTPGFDQMPKKINNDAEIIHYMLNVGSKHEVSLNSLQRLSSDELLSYYLKHASKRDTPIDLAQMRRHLEIFKGNSVAMFSYRPTRLMPENQPLIFLRAVQRDEFNAKYPEKGWKALCGECMTIHEVQGNHLTMMQEPNMKEVAKMVEIYLA